MKMNSISTKLLLASVAFFGVAAVAAPEAKSPKDGGNLAYKNYHLQVMKSLQPEMAFKEGADVKEWQEKLRAKLRELVAYPSQWDRKVEAQFKRIAETDEFTHDEITFTAEPGCDIVAYLVKPKKIQPPYPVMICLHGHDNNGIKTSVNPKEIDSEHGCAHALQAIANGWAAVALEQRGYGRRAGIGCQGEAMRALMVGKHIIGERCFDVSRIIDFIETQADLNAKEVACTGLSSGGTVAFYAACLDPRIHLSAPACSFGTFERSWMESAHCPCGYIPGIMKFADMPDFAGLIAPQNLLIIAGKDDRLSKVDGVKEGFALAQKIFKAADCPDHVRLIIGDGGHVYYPKQAWPEINKIRDSWRLASSVGGAKFKHVEPPPDKDGR